MMMVCMSHDVLMWLLSLLFELISEFPSVHYNTDASPQDRWWQDRVSEKTSDIHSRSLSLSLFLFLDVSHPLRRTHSCCKQFSLCSLV